jgi:hypothetical protein
MNFQWQLIKYLHCKAKDEILETWNSNMNIGWEKAEQ